ncbi:hypothetical protein BH11PLA2_BH11PLA2_21650 [soil metagenome]
MLRSLVVLLFLFPALQAADLDVLLPENSEQVTYVNVKRLAASTIVKTMLMKEIKERLKETEVPKWLKVAGIEPWKDIDTISMAVNQPRPNRKDAADKKADEEVDPQKKRSEVQMFFIMRGKFDGEKFFATAEKAIADFGDIVSMVKEDGLRMVRIKGKNGPEFFITMVDEQTIVGATKTQLLHDAVKQADKKEAKPAVKQELAALVKTLDDKAVFYQAQVIDGKDVAEGLRENPLTDDLDTLKKQVAEMTSYSLTARVDSEVAFEFSTAMKTKAAAEEFGETAKGMVEKGRGLLPLLAATAKEFTSIVNDLKKHMKVTVTGDIVKLSARITGNSIGQAFGVEE